MSDFVNTVDLIGDDALIDSIIDRSITECADNNITRIGKYAFRNCSALVSVDLPSATRIDSYAFSDCSSLVSINFPLVTNIESDAFFRCSKLTSVDFPLVTSIDSSVFKNCSSLISANFPLVTSIESEEFYDCSKLTSVNFPQAISIGGSAFRYCSKLTTVDSPSVTKIGFDTFSSCSRLTTLILRNTNAVCTLGMDALASTPIESGTGYVYVPAALVDSYKAKSGWKTYANQFRALENYTVDGTTTGALDDSKVNA